MDLQQYSINSGYPFLVRLFNFVQYLCQISGSVLTCLLAIITIIGLISTDKKVLAGYQSSVIAMSFSLLIYGILQLMLLPVFGIQGYEYALVYQLAPLYNEVVATVLLEIQSLFARLTVELMASCMLYRTCLVLKPQWATRFGIFLLFAILPYPIYQIIVGTATLQWQSTCDLICTENNYTEPKSLKMRDVSSEDGLDIFMFSTVLLIGVPCIYKLQKFFKTGNYSERTLQMQKRLTWTLGAMMIGHISSFIPFLITQVVAIIDLIFHTHLVTASMMFAVVLFSWSYPVKMWILYISCKNILKVPNCLGSTLKKVTKRKVGNLTTSDTQDLTG